jgi:hypothetical protein
MYPRASQFRPIAYALLIWFLGACTFWQVQ